MLLQYCPIFNETTNYIPCTYIGRSMLRLVTECPVLEDTLMRVLVIGLSRELPLNASEAVEFADVLVRRAANLSVEGVEGICLA